MINVKKDKCCSKLAAAILYMLRRITVAESPKFKEFKLLYVIYVKKDNCCCKSEFKLLYDTCKEG